MSFVPRQIEQMYRLALHYCCMRRDTIVRPSDVKSAATLVLKSFHMIVHWMEENPELNDNDEDERGVAQRYKGLMKVVGDFEDEGENGYYAVTLIMDDLKARWGLSQTSCYKWINRFEDKGWIYVERKNGQKYIKPRTQ